MTTQDKLDLTLDRAQEMISDKKFAKARELLAQADQLIKALHDEKRARLNLPPTLK